MFLTLNFFPRQTRLDRLPLIMMSFRAVVQKPLSFFLENRVHLTEHNTKNGTEGDDNKVFKTHDYRNLYNLVTHNDQRSNVDRSTKAIFAAFLLHCLKVYAPGLGMLKL